MDEFESLIAEIEKLPVKVGTVTTTTSSGAPVSPRGSIAANTQGMAPVSPRGSVAANPQGMAPVSPRGSVTANPQGMAPVSPRGSVADGQPATMSAGPGAAGRGVMSAGPGARVISSGPGALGRGGMSFGPGVTKAWAPLGSVPNAAATVVGPGRVALTHVGPPCAKCGQMILGNVTHALDKTWHPEHFNCFHCGVPFSGNYVIHENNAYCPEDYFELFGERCVRCLLPIKTSKIAKYGKAYHPEHFTCEGCGDSIINRQYMEIDGSPYCVPCYRDKMKRSTDNRYICATCGDRINGEGLLLAGEFHHYIHFKCACCLKGVDLNYGEHQGKIYCNICIRNILKNICAYCNEPASGRTVTALGHIYHPEHFICWHCHEPFAGGNFREHEGKPYCLKDYRLVLCKGCAKCGFPVDEGGQTAFGKFWHSEHFVCSGCEKNLVGHRARHWEQKLYCSKCFDHLPSQVKKEIEKLEKYQKKIKEKQKKEKAAEQKIGT